MTRFLPLLLLGALLLAPSAIAQQPYSISWPDDDPIWELDVLPPSLSSGPDGSGVEIRDVRYRGRTVMKRGHVPILNVKYEAACNCFRDWQYQEVRFIADNPLTSPDWIAESTPGTVATMCDVAPDNCSGGTCSDVGDFTGVAVERFETFLRLTTHMPAGWYRYTMRWEFHEDGTIRPLFGFTSTGTSCTDNPRRHHAYWRFDFDIDGADNDYIVENHPTDGEVVFETEETRSWDEVFHGNEEEHDIITSWAVMDTETGRGYTVTPSQADLRTPMNPRTGNPAIDNFAREDAVIARYDPSELDDGDWTCEADFTGGGSQPVVNGESVYDEDVVLWYRSGTTKENIDAETCYEAGPILTPAGDWGQAGDFPTAEEGEATPTGFALEDPYPNPFDGTTTVRFSVENAQEVTLTLFDSVGREVRTLYAGTPSAGSVESVVIDGTDLPAGVYTVRLDGEGISGSKRITLVK